MAAANGNADIAREYRKRYGKKPSNSDLARLMVEENPTRFTFEQARFALRRIEGNAGTTSSPAYKVKEFKTRVPRKSDPRTERIKDSLTPLKDRIRHSIRKKEAQTISELAEDLQTSKKAIKNSVAELINDGFNLIVDGEYVVFSTHIQKSKHTKISDKKAETGFYRFGVIGDNHLCSRYAREDVLNSLYDRFEAEGITTVYNTGNWIDGEARFNKQDLNVHGMDRQIEYFVEKYPKRKGIKTYFIAGDDHEGWSVQNVGVNIGKYAEKKAIEAGREDLIYIGYMEADVVLNAPNGKTTVRIVHPGGGSAYATSYTMQKLIESYQTGEKPDIVLAGHYHKAEYLFYRGVHIIQSGCTQDQTPFMRKKRLAAHLGGWIIEFSTHSSGAIDRFKQEFFPYYDNGYYKKWAYKV